MARLVSGASLLLQFWSLAPLISSVVTEKNCSQSPAHVKPCGTWHNTQHECESLSCCWQHQWKYCYHFASPTPPGPAPPSPPGPAPPSPPGPAPPSPPPTNGSNPWNAGHSMLIYEMDLLHFAGTFQNATKRLDDLRAYGINVIWLLPPYTRFKDAPYSTNDFTKIDPRLGTNQDAKDFVDKAHSLDMKVLFDITTIGHGCQAPSLEGVRPADLPFLNPIDAGIFPDLCEYKYCTEPQAIISFYTKIFTQWVLEAGIDGYRTDTADISRYGNCPDMMSGKIRDEFWHAIISNTRKSTSKELYFVAENTDLNMVDIWIKAGFNSASATMVGAFGWYDDISLVKAVTKGDVGSYTAMVQRVMCFHAAETSFFRLRSYISTHDTWDYGVTGVTPYGSSGGNPLLVFGSAAGVHRAYLLSLFASTGTVSITNGQEFGYTKPSLNFNDADASSNIDFSMRTASIDEMHRFAGPLFVKYGDLFRDGDVKFCVVSDSFAIVRAVGTRQIGVFIGDACQDSEIGKKLTKSILSDDIEKYANGLDVRATNDLAIVHAGAHGAMLEIHI